jgi:hypothetical protein
MVSTKNTSKSTKNVKTCITGIFQEAAPKIRENGYLRERAKNGDFLLYLQEKGDDFSSRVEIFHG